LANLLQLAAAGNANPEQLKTLGLLIQSLANANPDVNGAPIASQASPNIHKDTQATAISSTLPKSLPYAYLPPVREFDIVLEFQESMSERRIFPRGPVVCERVSSTWGADASCDILISTRLPFPKVGFGNNSDKEDAPTEDITQQLVTLRLKKAPIAVWDTIHRWVGNAEQILKQNRQSLEELVREAFPQQHIYTH
jgi:hypothetical protein